MRALYKIFFRNLSYSVLISSFYTRNIHGYKTTLAEIKSSLFITKKLALHLLSYRNVMPCNHHFTDSVKCLPYEFCRDKLELDFFSIPSSSIFVRQWLITLLPHILHLLREDRTSLDSSSNMCVIDKKKSISHSCEIQCDQSVKNHHHNFETLLKKIKLKGIVQFALLYL